MCVCMCTHESVCASMHVCMRACVQVLGRTKELASPDLEWQLVLSHPRWMLATKLESSAKAVWAFNCWVISAALLLMHFILTLCPPAFLMHKKDRNPEFIEDICVNVYHMSLHFSEPSVSYLKSPVNIKIFFSSIKCFPFFTLYFYGYSKLLPNLLSPTHPIPRLGSAASSLRGSPILLLFS